MLSRSYQQWSSSYLVRNSAVYVTYVGKKTVGDLESAEASQPLMKQKQTFKGP